MGSPGFQSDSAAMTKAVQGFDECATGAAKTMAELENDLVSVLSRYAGDQANAFWQLHTKLQDDMKVASRELENMSNLVNQSFHNYGSGDATVSDSFRNLNSAVGAGGSVLNRLSGGAG